MSGQRRKWSPIRRPLNWHRDGVRIVWHFIMSYQGDGKPGVIVGEPYQTHAGDWLVEVRLDSGRTVRAALEALDEVT